jgi:hypothetical protein
MSDDKQQVADNTQKDPKDWKTGGLNATGAQISYLETIAAEAGEKIDTKNLTKDEAAKKIEE